MRFDSRSKASLASMGPRSFNRGNAASLVVMSRDHESFNGAAVFQPRKRSDLRPLRRYGLRASMGPRSFNRGNLSRHRLRVCNAATRTASMGPRSFNRGNNAVPGGPDPAATMLQWGRGLSTAETSSGHRWAMSPINRFNGAAVFQPRKPCRIKSRRHELRAASMGPRSFNRGNTTHGVKWQCPTNCFNGAAVFQPRKRSNSAHVRSTGPCFNGAAVFQPRKPEAGVPLASNSGSSFNGAAVFQPRKRCQVRVRTRRRGHVSFNGAAVFQPRKRPAGAERSTQAARLASMGPRSFNRGNDSTSNRAPSG